MSFGNCRKWHFGGGKACSQTTLVWSAALHTFFVCIHLQNLTLSPAYAAFVKHFLPLGTAFTWAENDKELINKSLLKRKSESLVNGALGGMCRLLYPQKWADLTPSIDNKCQVGTMLLQPLPAKNTPCCLILLQLNQCRKDIKGKRR